jgi:hypothetical protein
MSASDREVLPWSYESETDVGGDEARIQTHNVGEDTDLGSQISGVNVSSNILTHVSDIPRAALKGCKPLGRNDGHLWWVGTGALAQAMCMRPFKHPRLDRYALLQGCSSQNSPPRQPMSS